MVQFRPTLSALALLASVVALIACGGPSENASKDAGLTPQSPAGEAAAGRANENPDPAAPVVAGADQKLGAALADPARYYGVFASADSPDRQWFVAEAKRPEYAEQAPEVPPGHLALGAMFGDVAPYQLKTLSETEFEQAWVSDYQPEAISIQFELNDDGRAIALTFTNQQNAPLGRLERQGDLPEGWD